VSKKRILAVDDDKVALGAVRQMLSQKGYEVVTADSAEQALEKIGEPFDLFLLDVGLPGLSGFDLCRRIRESAASRDAAVVFLTAKGKLGDMSEGREAGSDLYLVKPVLAAKLFNMVGMFLSADGPLAKKRGLGPART
jgi:DNA-binding response OmpR family regulator